MRRALVLRSFPFPRFAPSPPLPIPTASIQIDPIKIGPPLGLPPMHESSILRQIAVRDYPARRISLRPPPPPNFAMGRNRPPGWNKTCPKLFLTGFFRKPRGTRDDQAFPFSPLRTSFLFRTSTSPKPKRNCASFHSRGFFGRSFPAPTDGLGRGSQTPPGRGRGGPSPGPLNSLGKTRSQFAPRNPRGKKKSSSARGPPWGGPFLLGQIPFYPTNSARTPLHPPPRGVGPAVPALAKSTLVKKKLFFSPFPVFESGPPLKQNARPSYDPPPPGTPVGLPPHTRRARENRKPTAPAESAAAVPSSPSQPWAAQARLVPASNNADETSPRVWWRTIWVQSPVAAIETPPKGQKAPLFFFLVPPWLPTPFAPKKKKFPPPPLF